MQYRKEKCMQLVRRLFPVGKIAPPKPGRSLYLLSWYGVAAKKIV
jgi:hypothetical protein